MDMDQLEMGVHVLIVVGGFRVLNVDAACQGMQVARFVQLANAEWLGDVMRTLAIAIGGTRIDESDWRTAEST